MSAGDLTEGRRLEVLVNPDTGRDDVNLNMPWEPGEYTGPIRGYTAERAAVFFSLPLPEGHPDAGVRHVCDGPDGHTFSEEPDGTLTISPSILAVRSAASDPPPWHGYLERGVWREC